MRKIRYKEASSSFNKLAEPNFERNSRSSIGMENFSGEFYYLSVEKLVPYAKQARVVFDEQELENLAQTIKAHGIRQPLTVIKSPNFEDKFEVISGERRLRASKIAGLNNVPCIILDNVSNAEEIALIENIQRQDLHPIELARSLRTVLEKRGWGAQTELHAQLGIPNSQISELLKLTSLSTHIQELILEKNFRGRENLRKLLGLEKDEEKERFISFFEENKKQEKQGKDRSLTAMSVLRFSMREGDIKVQKSGLRHLTQLQKEDLKIKLEEILKEIS